MGRVFVVEKPKAHINISFCCQYGQIVYLFAKGDKRCSIFDVKEFGRAVLAKLEEHDFDPSEDYICIVGSLISSVLACVALSCVWDGYRVLLHNAVDGTYTVEEIGFDVWGEEETKETGDSVETVTIEEREQ